MRWFPIIPRLRHAYACKHFARLMTWHADGHDSHAAKGSMRFLHHSLAWGHVDQTYPDFANDARNVRFVLATDGINPYKLMRSKHSTWPVLLVNYNIPPWLAIKKGHVMLSLIIPGKSYILEWSHLPFNYYFNGIPNDSIVN